MASEWVLPVLQAVIIGLSGWLGWQMLDLRDRMTRMEVVVQKIPVLDEWRRDIDKAIAEIQAEIKSLRNRINERQ